MTRNLRALLPLAILLPTLAARTDDPVPLRGFSAARSREEREWEAKFQPLISTDTLRESLRRLSARPHHLGSPYDRENAEWILGKFRAWGLEASIDTFLVLFPTPKERVVELVAPTKFVAKLKEPALKGDPTSSQQAEQLPTYNAYSADGDVTAPLVYVNYGMPDDYIQLERMGISVQGAIVIARYGTGWRGLKPKLAAEHGAVGCLIYSDPRDDGYGAGDSYPAGGYRPNEGVQRGSVKDQPIGSGDPLTPGVGAKPGAKRLPIDSALGITKIPVLPISYGDAQPLLAAIGGRIAPEAWRGGLAMAYHVGPGPARVHLRVKADWKMTPLYDVIGRLPGTGAPDEWIIRGNHQDAWVNGADDPLAGLVALLEEARAMGTLARQGWHPRRTIIFAAWDGEEQGLLGSTEWAEEHADELRAHAAVYINSDGNGRGYLGAGGSHTLERVVNEASRDVQDPETGLTIWKRQRLGLLSATASADDRRDLRERADLRLDALGSGSDFTPFLQHLGIASLNLGFGGEDPNSGGVYHSIYDDFAWYTRFSDTSFVYGRALAQVAGTVVMRLAAADVLPYNPGGFAETIGRYVDEVKKLAVARRDSIVERNLQLDEGVFQAISDPRQPLKAPAREAEAPFLNFAPLENASAALTRSAQRYEAALDKAAAGDGAALERPEVRAVNPILVQLERAMIRDDGLPGRPWYKHQVYAPGLLTGYAVKTLPAVREAIEGSQWNEVDNQASRTAEAIAAAAEKVDTAAAVLERANP
jgi:N-acetylated-alpha-linked acidic dipeptidase